MVVNETAWRNLVERALSRAYTPIYLSAWQPVFAAKWELKVLEGVYCHRQSNLDDIGAYLRAHKEIQETFQGAHLIPLYIGFGGGLPGPARTLGKIGWRGSAFCERILRVTFCVVHERTLHACNRSTGCG